MIRSRDVNKEIANVEAVVEKAKDATAIQKAVVKLGILILKVVRDIKTNQVLELKKLGVELIKESRDEKEKEEKK